MSPSVMDARHVFTRLVLLHTVSVEGPGELMSIAICDEALAHAQTTVDTFSSIFTVGRTLYGYSTPYGNTAAARFSVRPLPAAY